MKRSLLLCILALSQFVANAQSRFNGNLEEIDPLTKSPKNWNYYFAKDQGKSYPVTLDSINKQGGKYSLMIAKSITAAAYGVIEYIVPANFDGESIELRGYLKTQDVANGYAGIWVRLEDDNKKVLAFDNMQSRGVKGTNDWALYAIKLPYQNETRTIHVGGLLVGDGKAWFDTFQLFIDGRPIEKAKLLTQEKIMSDTLFSKGSRISAFEPSPQQVINLTLAGQFWGFLKYHHPSVAKGNYNWDAELFKLLPSVIAAKNNTELSEALEQYINLLPVPEKCKSCNQAPGEKQAIAPAYGMLFTNKILSKTLTAKLTYIKENRNNTDNYYIDFAKGIGNPIFNHEKPYATMSYPDAGYRLLSLYRYWNMINYFFPYKDIIDEDWNTVLSNFVPVFLAAKDEKEYALTTLKIIAKISDTHANIWTSLALYEMKGKLFTTFDARFIEDKLVVTGFYTDTLEVKNKLQIGDVIVAINGKNVQDLVKSYLSITPASNYDAQLRDLPSAYLLRSNNNVLNLKVQRDNEIFDYVAPLIKPVYKNLDYTKPTGYYLYNKDIGYVYPGKYKNTDLPAIKKLFAGTKGMVIDMRSYPSDFMPFTFGDYIKAKNSTFVKFTQGSVTTPGSFNYAASPSNGGAGDFKGKVVIIVNATTQSNAEYTTMSLQGSPNVTVIGSTTAGADGNVSSIVLPGGLSTMISGLGVFYPDGTPTQRVGVKIDYRIKPTIKGIKEGRDELLEKAVELINQ